MSAAKQFFWTIVVLGAGLICMTERAVSTGSLSPLHAKTSTAQTSILR